MKKSLVFGIVAITILIGLGILASAYDCIDTDNGLNSTIQGTVTFNGQVKYKDSCASGGEISRVNNLEALKGDVLEFSCYSESGSEICSSGACLYSVLKCSDGQTCNDGKCVSSEELEDSPFYLPAGINCEDSDGGIKYDIKGIVKYRVDESVNRAEDYCVDDKELREGYCNPSKKPLSLSVTQCEGICACGKCFNKGEDLNCKADYQKYCNDESCYIPEKDFGEIKYISMTRLTGGCLVAGHTCKMYVGKYSFNSYPVQSSVELNTALNFLQLSNAIKKKFDQEPTIDDKSYVLDDGNNLHIFWISDKKIISLEIPKILTDSNKEDEDVGDIIREYQTVHPSDIQKNLNFFEKVIQWFKNLFGA